MSMRVTRIIPAIVVVIVGIGPAVSTGAPLLYSGKEIRASVVDAETGQPVDGAVVVAVWQLTPVSGEGPRLHVGEVVTDRGGAFFMPGWGPIARPPLTEAQSDFPYLIVFKHGYVPVKLRNAPKSDFARIRSLPPTPAKKAIYATGYEGTPADSVQESVWNGMAIRIEAFRGSSAEWYGLLKNIQIDAGWRDVARMQRFYRALLDEHAYLQQHPPDTSQVDKRFADSFFDSIERRLKRGRNQ